MYEVELKIPADHEAVLQALTSLEAEYLGAVRQVDTYYDAPHRDFAATDEALRLRREYPEDGEATVAVTYKGPLVEAESKTREEAETVVGDGGEMATVLENLGFEPAATVSKDRDRYAVGEFTVTLDAVDGLGEFVEVETAVSTDGHEGDGDGPPAAVRGARERAGDLLVSLGLDPADQIRTAYLGLLLAEGPDRDGDD